MNSNVIVRGGSLRGNQGFAGLVRCASHFATWLHPVESTDPVCLPARATRLHICAAPIREQDLRKPTAPEPKQLCPTLTALPDVRKSRSADDLPVFSAVQPPRLESTKRFAVGTSAVMREVTILPVHQLRLQMSSVPTDRTAAGL